MTDAEPKGQEAGSGRQAATDTGEHFGEWWDWRLLGRWVVVNTAAFLVIVIGGVVLEQLASQTTEDLARDHRLLAIMIVAVIGAVSKAPCWADGNGGSSGTASATCSGASGWLPRSCRR